MSKITIFGGLELRLCISEVTVRPEILAYLIMLTYELAFGMNNKVVENFIFFPESLGSPLLDNYISSYG